MSMEILSGLQESHVFDPAPPPFDLGKYHVPFDEITGKGTVEAVLSRSVRVPERVGIMGRSSSGKSSAIAFVLGPMEEGIAPIRIPVTTEDEGTITTPDGFARHVIRTVSNYARDAALLSDNDRRKMVEGGTEVEQLSSHAKKLSFGASLAWLAGKADLGAELTSAAEPTISSRSGSEAVEQAGRVVDVVGSAGLVPVLVVDDSDSWFNVEGRNDRTHLVDGFFGPVIRMLTEQLNAALVVAVHDTYAEMDGFKQAQGFLETIVRIPDLPDEDAIRAILAKRVSLHCEVSLGDVMSADAVSLVFGYCSGPAAGNLRRTLLLCHSALQAALSDGASLISAGHIETALAELSP
jgi:hypothetical protein